MWTIEFSTHFGHWWQSLAATEQESVTASIGLLRQLGPSLSRPHADTLNGSRHPNMKELRIQHRGRPFRVLFAFDPRRHAILLLGGDKTSNKRFYTQMISLADQLYDQHLANLKQPKRPGR